MGEFLVADIGGSNSRFALADSEGWPERIVVIKNKTVADLETAVARYLEEAGVRPRVATFAIAGPIHGDDIALTNCAWHFRRSDFANRFGFSRLRIVNDFEAIAWALPQLTPAHTRPLGRCTLRHEGVKLVLGPGTGLGVAALLPAAGGGCAIATEGGHISFGANAHDEEAVFALLRKECGVVSAEMVLSGPGLLRLAGALHTDRGYHDPETIIAHAHSGDPQAQAITRLFVRLLGRFVGDMALTFKALGGVYLTGGVACALGRLLDEPQFRAAFEAHPPHQVLLQAIPTLLITYDHPGLIGCAALARMSAGG
jgi:glucokinase